MAGAKSRTCCSGAHGYTRESAGSRTNGMASPIYVQTVRTVWVKTRVLNTEMVVTLWDRGVQKCRTRFRLLFFFWAKYRTNVSHRHLPSREGRQSTRRPKICASTPVQVPDHTEGGNDRFLLTEIRQAIEKPPQPHNHHTKLQ